MELNNDKYNEILDYLIEFKKNNDKPVIDIEHSEDEYQSIIWLADLPNHELCECISNPGFNEEATYWIRAKKPVEPKKPYFAKLSDVLEQWIVKESLTDENKTPLLKHSIVVNGTTMLSTSFPQIIKEFKDYVSGKWQEDLIDYKIKFEQYETRFKEYEKLNRAYNFLLNIYDKLQQDEGDLELVVGAGLINFNFSKVSNFGEDFEAPVVCRHILTRKMDITYEFNQRDSIITIQPDDSYNIQIETDAINDIPLFESDNIIEAEKQSFYFLRENNISGNLFNTNTKAALQLFVNNLSSECSFIDELIRNAEVTDKPVINFAPALMLRKKHSGGITALFDKIKSVMKNVEDDENISSVASSENDRAFKNTIENDEEDSVYDTANMLEKYNVEHEHDNDNHIKISNAVDFLSMPEFLIFTSQHNVYKVQNKAFKNKMQIFENVAFDSGEKPIYITGTRNYSGYLIAAFENGKIAKITMESYKTEFNRKKLKNAYNDESRLIFIEHILEDTDLVAVSNINKVILFNTKAINPVGSKTTKGFYVMKSKDGSIMAKVRKLEHVKFQDPGYYRRDEGLNVVGFYLKQGDEIN